MGVKKKDDGEVSRLLQDTVVSVCKNTFPYLSHISIDGLLGITLDNEEVVLINIKEIFSKGDMPTAIQDRSNAGKRPLDFEVSSNAGDSSSCEENGQKSVDKRRRKRRRKQKCGVQEQSMIISEKYDGESLDEISDKISGENMCIKVEEDMTIGKIEEGNIEKDSLYGVTNLFSTPRKLQDITQNVSSLNSSPSQMQSCAGSSSSERTNIFQDPHASSRECENNKRNQERKVQDCVNCICPEGKDTNSLQLNQGFISASPAQTDEISHKLDFETPSTSEDLVVDYSALTCPICGAKFTRKYSLKRHIVTHAGKTPYFQCPVCLKVIKRKDNYKIHLTSHDILVTSV